MKLKDNRFSDILDNVAGLQCCPNFFISGESTTSREKLGIAVSDELCQRKLINFKGVKKRFSIRLPFCNSLKEMNSFLSHLQNSVSIARDCYESFRGIVMVEMDSDWSETECENSIEPFFDYIGSHEDICFIVIFPGVISQDCCSFFYNEISDYGYWIHLEMESLTIDSCVGLFEKMITESGFKVESEVLDALREVLKTRNQDNVGNQEAVEQLVKRIVFERTVSENRETKISKDEIMRIYGQKNSKVQIGFAADVR